MRTVTLALSESEMEILWTRFAGDDGALDRRPRAAPGQTDSPRGCPVALSIEDRLLQGWRDARPDGEPAGEMDLVADAVIGLVHLGVDP